MKIFKKILIMMMCLFLLFDGCEKASAAMEDVTNTITNKSRIKKLSYEFRDLLGYYVNYSLENGENILFDFSKKKSRQEAIRFSDWKYGKLNASAQNKLSQQLFGVGVTKIEQMQGEWGCEHPALKIFKIYRISAKQYQIKVNIYMEDDDGGCEKFGTAVIFVKKSLKAKYGYYAKKIKAFR